MISQGAVSLRAARQDCGLGATGGLKNTEFRERAGTSNPSLASLRGTIACRSSKQPTGQYVDNFNQGTACRPNYSEANVFNLDSYQVVVLTSGVAVSNCYPFNEHDSLGGYSFVGTLPGGSFKCQYHFDKQSYGATQIEVIGFSSGYFAGNVKYYLQKVTDGLNETVTLNSDSNFPYLTVVIQALGWEANPQGNSKLKVYSMRAYK